MSLKDKGNYYAGGSNESIKNRRVWYDDADVRETFKLIMEDIEKHSEGGDCLPKCKVKAMIRHRLGVWGE